MIINQFKPSITELAPHIEQAIKDDHDVRITVTGFSMYPLLRNGSDDVVLTKPQNLKKYDVVLFKRQNGDYIFHRIIKIKNGVFTIAGDNETIKEYPVTKDAVIAVMKSFSRLGKPYSISKIWYKIYCRIWVFIFPIRPFAAKLFYVFARTLRKIKGAFCHKKA